MPLIVTDSGEVEDALKKFRTDIVKWWIVLKGLQTVIILGAVAALVSLVAH